MPSSVKSVFPVSGKLGLAPVWHTLNTGDLVLRDQHYYALDPLSQIVIDMLKL